MNKRSRSKIRQKFPIGSLVTIDEPYYVSLSPHREICKSYMGLVVKFQHGSVFLFISGKLIERSFEYFEKRARTVQKPYSKF